MLDGVYLTLVFDSNDEAVNSLAAEIGEKLIKNTDPGGALAPKAVRISQNSFGAKD